MAAVVLPLIAAFIGLSMPRATPLSTDVPAPHVSRAAVARAEREDLRLIERMRDAPALRFADRAFGEWNQSEVPPGTRTIYDSGRSLQALRSAFAALTHEQKRQFLADRSERFIALVHQIREKVARKREAPDEARAMRMLVGGRFEGRAIESGLLDADDVVLRAAFKLRIVLFASPDDLGLVPRVEQIAFHGFIAARARGQSVAHRLRSVEELGRLDRSYPAHLAAAQLLAIDHRWAEASAELQQQPHPTVRTRNHLLWLARKQG